jgi:sulfate adenylyltransferase subunit 1
MEQTRRHLLLARLLGVRHAIVFVNKMDLVGYSQAIFEGVRDEVNAFAAPLGFETFDVLPGSALKGDMVVGRGTALDWFSGQTLLERLEALDSGVEQAAVGPFRLPVQLVSRPQGQAARGYLGRIESGTIAVGDEVQILPSGRRTRVREIRSHESLLASAAAGDSITLVLADDIDIARGDLIAGAERLPREARALDATLVWLDAEPMRAAARYLVQQATRRTLGRVQEVLARLDVHTLEEQPPSAAVQVNDIVRSRIVLQSPLFIDGYEAVRSTGSFILIDEATNRTVAAGMLR